MISRYNRPKIEKIWSDENKFKIWTEIECLIAEQLSNIKKIPKDAAINIRKNAKFNVNEIQEIEKETKHDMLAYIKNVSNYIGKNSEYFHYGVTSSDIIDTCFSIQLKKSAEIIIEQLKELISSLKEKSEKYKNTIIIGRSHGIHAETTTFGLKIRSYYFEFIRNLNRLELAKQEISICSISGPVGTYNSIDPSVEKYVANKLNLSAEDVSTQIIPRDRHAYFFAILGIIGSSIERLATEIRHLQRTEVLEVEEGFGKGQKGSSAMPHKKNQILSENLTGLARVVRSLTIPALENITSWHERDISHSSVERINAPNATITLDFAVQRMITVLDNLIIHKKNMVKNLNLLKGLPYSQNVLIFLIDNKVLREDAYKIVQDCALKTWEGNLSFKDNLLSHPSLAKFKISSKIDKIFNNKSLFTNVDKIFKRVS